MDSMHPKYLKLRFCKMLVLEKVFLSPIFVLCKLSFFLFVYKQNQMCTYILLTPQLLEFDFAYKDKQLAGDAKDVTCRNQKGVCDRSTVSVRFLIYLEKQMRCNLPHSFPFL